MPQDEFTIDSLVETLLAVTKNLDLDSALRTIVNTAQHLTGAKYAALGVLEHGGHPGTFVHTDLGREYDHFVATTSVPVGGGVLGAISAHEALLLDNIADHPASIGFPPGHPPMRTFMGAPVMIGGEMYGRIYLTDKFPGFTATDERFIKLLASAAAIAVRNAEIYDIAQTRERWVAVGQEITTAMLEGTDIEDALQLIAERVRAVARADTACIVLEGLDDTWMIEFTDGDDVGDLVGIQMPPDGRAARVLASGQGIIVESFARSRSLRVPEFGRYGPALYVPLLADGQSKGVIILLRSKGAPEFQIHDLDIATVIAHQTALALTLAEAREAQDHATILDERARISRDLHDMAIQQLFATGLQITRIADELAPTNPQMARQLQDALDGVDDSVRQIRATVNALRDEEQISSLSDRLEREISLARTGLGFAPSVVINAEHMRMEDVNAVVDDSLADDIVAVVREGLANTARHAHASTVSVELRVCADELAVTVEDDGVGISPERARNSGLANLGARAQRRGGTFTLSSPSAHSGALLTWVVPLN